MSKDGRGVKRGRCTDVNCSCVGYNGGIEGKKCYRCCHPPGKHENLDIEGHRTGFSQATPTDLSGSHHSPYLHSQWQRPEHLPMCRRDGCTNQVWYEPSLQGQPNSRFDYCSPECRDLDLLPAAQVRLKGDLEKMKKELHRVAAADTLKSKEMATQESLTKHSSLVSHHATGSGTLLLMSPTGGKNKQKTTKFTIKKEKNEKLGIILHKSQCSFEEGRKTGLVIVGVAKGSRIFKSLQDDKLKLLDVIEAIDDTPCQEMFSSNGDLQDQFECYVRERESIKLSLNHSFSLPPASGPLAYARRKYVIYTYVVALTHSWNSVCDHEYLGLNLVESNGRIKVVGVTKQSPADMSRVKFDDEICMYVLAPQARELCPSQLVSETDLTAINADLENARTSGWNVILFV